MNEFIQAFMMSHNYEMNVDPSDINPDRMSYEVQSFYYLLATHWFRRENWKCFKGTSKIRYWFIETFKNSKEDQ